MPLARSTQFGWNTDPNQDYNTNVLKIGMRDNPLTAHAAALTRLMQQQLKATPGDVIELTDGKGHKTDEYFADRAPESDARVDMYQPQGFDKSIPDFQNAVNLGGGNSRLSGARLAAAGEANVAKLGQIAQGDPSTPPAPVSALAATTAAPAVAANQPPASSPAPFFNPYPATARPINIAQPNPMMSNPAQQQPASMGDSLSHFYASHPVFAALQGAS